MKQSLLLLLLLSLVGCGEGVLQIEFPSPDDTLRFTPLTDLDTGRYKGLQGGLYSGGRDTMPSAHSAAGRTRAARIRPLDTSGQPSTNGRYVLLSIGMSNTSQEFCAPGGGNCGAWTFMGKAAADTEVNHTTLAIVNGARGGATAGSWTTATAPNYDSVRITRLAPRGLSEQQVQIVWLKVANANPTVPITGNSGDAVQLQTQMGQILRALRTRYPNLQQVFISSRVYGGYATTSLNPEPYAYESGFAVKFVIEAQITEIATGVVNARAGTLNYNIVAPWAAWGPYLWADRTRPRDSDGLTWQRSDFEADGTHPSQSGEEKVADMLLQFFKTSTVTACWFLTGRVC